MTPTAWHAYAARTLRREQRTIEQDPWAYLEDDPTFTRAGDRRPGGGTRYAVVGDSGRDHDTERVGRHGRSRPNPPREPRAMTVKAPPLTEKEFLRQVTDLATRRGWSWVHFLPAMHKDNWRTPFQGPLGKGWPDLVLVRNDEIIFAELKREGAKPTPEQEAVLDALRYVAHAPIWHPSDWPMIEKVLR